MLAALMTLQMLSTALPVPMLLSWLEPRKPSYNWAEMLRPQFHKLKNIKMYQHFRFDSSMPGVLHYKTSSDSEEQMIVLLKNPTWSPLASSLPDPVLPAGLSVERQ